LERIEACCKPNSERIWSEKFGFTKLIIRSIGYTAKASLTPTGHIKIYNAPVVKAAKEHLYEVLEIVRTCHA
jgi:hypothetical protein